jgi:TfoX/Sxy family transcriptional regulator of competence genes
VAYSEELAARVRRLLDEYDGLSERRMFGGLCFMLHGNMCCGIVGEELMLRLGNAAAAEALSHQHTRRMDFTGKPMRSMLYVEPPGLATESALRSWVQKAAAYAGSLPPK